MTIRKTALMAAASIFFCLAIASAGLCADVAKIGTVNFQKIFDNSTAGKAVKQKITEEGQRMEADLRQKGEEIKEIKKMLDQDQDLGVMSKEARDEKKWQLDRKVDNVNALKRKYDRQIQEMQVSLVNQVRKDVLELIKNYGQKQGYLMIMEDLGVVYAPESLDITDEIIQLYNQDYSKNKKNG